MTQHLPSNETACAPEASLADKLAIHAYSELFLDEDAGAQQSSDAQPGKHRGKRYNHHDLRGRGKLEWW